ncbi:hypothetical protein MAPG_04389 [Magnaporthiopsis poae ATCC 64411]|uniref:Uncharacterized protein n=1 Tax=Magnaporthiopsis poae (strain ATCC 64411 / 73-15) TaxID=644358 RepID=A0A0C4DWK8_MAGP6|nr:hypothetical protein MAPG_04389 [Magnaporthiopsis poae ATCC 64411]
MENGDHKGKDRLGGPPQKLSSRPDGKHKAEKTPAKRPREPSGSLNRHNAKKTAGANAREPISEAGPSSAPQARAHPGVQTLPTLNCTWLASGIRIEHPHPPPVTNRCRSMNGGKISHRPRPPLWNNDRPMNGVPVNHTAPPRPRPRLPPPAEHDLKPKGSGGVDRRGPAKPGGPNKTFEVVLRGGEVVFKTARRGFSHIGSNAIRRANRSRAHCRNPNHNRFGALSSMGEENGSDFSHRGSEDANDGPPANGGSRPDDGGYDGGSPSTGPQDPPGAAAAGDDGPPASVKGLSDHSDSGQDGSNEDHATDVEAAVGQGWSSVTEIWAHMGRNVARLATLGAILMTGLLQVAFHAVSHLARRCYEGLAAVFGEARQHDEGSATGRGGRGSGSNVGLLGARSRQQSRRRHGRATAVCRLPTLQELDDDDDDDESRQDGEGEDERQPAAEAASRAPPSVREE